MKLLAAEKMKPDASRKSSSSEAMEKVSSFNMIGALYITLILQVLTRQDNGHIPSAIDGEGLVKVHYNLLYELYLLF